MAKLADVTESISFLEKQLKLIKERTLEVEEDVEQLIAASTPLYTNYLLLRSIKGVGVINATVLLCVTGNFQRLNNPRKFACYCGAAPFEHIPGISTWGKTQASSLANKEVKAYFTRVAIAATSWNPQMKACYKRKIAEGKYKVSVINVVRTKTTARSLAVIRKQTPFITLAV